MHRWIWKGLSNFSPKIPLRSIKCTTDAELMKVQNGLAYEGFRPQRDGNYGPGVYTTSSFDEAIEYGRNSGVVLRLYIKVEEIKFTWWDHIPGSNNYDKHIWCMYNSANLVIIKPDYSRWWLFIPGMVGRAALIPGWTGFDVLDLQGQYQQFI